MQPSRPLRAWSACYSQVRHRRAELGVPGGSKGSLKQRALDGRGWIIEIVRLCAPLAVPRFALRFDHGTQRSMMLLLVPLHRRFVTRTA